MNHTENLQMLKVALQQPTVKPFTIPKLPLIKPLAQKSVPPAVVTAPLQSAPPTPIKSPPLGFNPKKLYEAITVPETGGEKNPWIRTKHITPKGSTAYGPVQMTKTLVEDYSTRMPKIFDKDEHGYIARYLSQGKNFLRYGREPNKPGYDPKWDYGGEGVLGGIADQPLYRSVAQKILSQLGKEGDYDVPRVVKRWRGVEDKPYLQKVLEALGG